MSVPKSSRHMRHGVRGRVGGRLVAFVLGAGMLASACAPTFIDAPVYDFEVPMLAAALRSHQIWFLEDLQDLPDYLLGPVQGLPMEGPEGLAAALPRWAGNAFAAQSRPGAFAALAFSQLG